MRSPTTQLAEKIKKVKVLRKKAIFKLSAKYVQTLSKTSFYLFTLLRGWNYVAKDEKTLPLNLFFLVKQVIQVIYF